MNKKGLRKVRKTQEEENQYIFHCPQCGKELIRVFYGEMWDWDWAECEYCGYDGYLDSMTFHDSDGTLSQEMRSVYED